MMLEVLPVVIARGQWTGVTNIVARMERSAIRDSRDAGPGLRFAPSGLQPRDLPVGLLLDRRVESFFGFSEKYFCSHLPQIRSRTLAVPAHRGAFRDRHGRWAWDAVDAAAFCARRGRRAGRKTCERSTASGREMLQRTAKSCGPDAPTLASSSRMFESAQPGADKTLVRRRRWQNSPVTGESTKETVKTIACGNAG